MIEVIKKDYWSRSDAFLLPLTGIPRIPTVDIRSYLFWQDYSIHDYKLTVTVEHSDQFFLRRVCEERIYPGLEKNGIILEAHHEGDKEIYIVDVSQKADDVELFLKGKYSKISKESKELIEKYHMSDGDKISIYIYAVIHPFKNLSLLGNKSSIEYVAENYGFDYEELMKIGELGSVYKEKNETLYTEE